MMNNKTEDKGMAIQDIFEKILFDEELDCDFLEDFLCAYSYFILKTNRDYKYNQTYLSSYFQDFIHVKQKLNEKKRIRDEVEKRIDNFWVTQNIRISIDQYWLLESDGEKIHSKLVGMINKERILSNKCLIEVEYISSNTDKIIVNEFINLNDKENIQKKRMDNVFKKLREIL